MVEARDQAIQFGSTDEKEWLNTYFKPGGGPPERPYYMPGTGEWVQERYPGRALQRRRKDFDGSVFYHPTDDKWALREDAAVVLKEKVLRQKPLIPLIALMSWMWRERELSSLEGALEKFINEIGFDRDHLLDEVYSREISQEFRDAGLSDNSLPAGTVADLIGAAPPPPVIPEFTSFVSQLEEQLKKRNVELIPELVKRIVAGWLVGDIVVLVGPTGSGKTFLAIQLGNSLEVIIGLERFWNIFIEVNRDYDVAQFLGYESLNGEFTIGKFTHEALFIGEPTDPRLVILDEWNLAQIDAYFAPILSVLETKRAIVLPGKLIKFANDEEIKRAQPEILEGRCILPEDTFFLATCNSWIDEPETRLPLSGPVKRRCRIIPMPNLLVKKLEEKGTDGITEICNTILKQEQEMVDRRIQMGRPSILDAHRAQQLQGISTLEALQEKTRHKLLQFSRILLQDVHTRSSFTVGLLRDILLSCVYAEPGQDFAALGEQVADKILHQIHGETTILQIIVELSREFPNAEEIGELAKRMGAFSTEKRIRPLI
jgi:hypothetical protein